MDQLVSGFKNLGEMVKEKISGPKPVQECMEKMRIELKDHKGKPVIHPISLKEELVDIKGCKRFTFGADSLKPNRTIMVLGATGAGKSTLINGMVNYILGVEWKDPFRFVLVDEPKSRSQAESQTSKVIAYKLNHQEGFQIDYSLTIIDTPGFGDTRGIERDREISAQMKELFTSKQGVSEIDAVCVVAQASLARLTSTQKYVFDCVLSIFGKDIKENIRVLVTFADNQIPPVLEAIKVSGVPCDKTKNGLPRHFKFNNSALFAPKLSATHDDDDDEDGGDASFDHMFWDMGNTSMKRFFNALPQIKTKSLILTKEVLHEREKLEVTIENLQKQYKLGMAKAEKIRKTHETIDKYKAKITANANFEVEVKILKPIQVHHKKYNTNCSQCNTTCTTPVLTAMIPIKYTVMQWMQKATAISAQKNATGVCILIRSTIGSMKKSLKSAREELYKEYQIASKDKKSVEELLHKLEVDYEETQLDVVNLMDTSARSLARLKEIALKPNPLSTPEYIDMLIKGEMSECKPGYEDRIENLKKMRKKAETLVKIGATLKPHSTPKYIDLLIEDEKSEGLPGYQGRIKALMAIRQKAETMIKKGRATFLPQK